MKKRILIVANHFHPYVGGLEKYALELATRLAEKHEVKVLTIKHSKDLATTEDCQGFEILRLSGINLLGGTYTLPKTCGKEYKLIQQHIKDFQPEIIFTNTRFFASSYLGMRLARQFKAKHIHIEHGNSFVQHPNKLVQIAARLWDETLGRKIISHADTVIGISDNCCKFSKQLGAKKTISIPNSLDIAQYKKVSSAKKNIGLKGSVVGFVGRLIQAKGVQHLIEACAGLGVTVLVVGDGPYRGTLESVAKEYRVETVFSGMQEADRINLYYSAMDIFVNPSYSEGLPTSVLEAGILGIPTIATNVGGTEQIIEEGISGTLVPPKNTHAIKEALKKLLKDEIRQERYSKESQRKIRKEFDWEKNIKKIEGLI